MSDEPLKPHDKVIQQADGTWRRERPGDPVDWQRGEVLATVVGADGDPRILPTAETIVEMMRREELYRLAPRTVLEKTLHDLGL